MFYVGQASQVLFTIDSNFTKVPYQINRINLDGTCKFVIK